MNLEDILKIGTRAAQPVATAVGEGSLYSVSDEGYKVEQSRAGAWITYAGSSSSSSGGQIANFPFFPESDNEYIEPLIVIPTPKQTREILAGTNVTFDDTVPGVRTINAAGGGSGGSWTLAGSWTWSTNVINVTFTDLGAYSEILIVFKDILLQASGQLYWIVSINNGVSYLNTSGDYQWIGAGGALTANAWFRPFANPSSAARSGWITINPFNSADYKIMDSPMLPLTALIPTLNALNAIQVGMDGTNITGGSIRVYGR